MSDDNKKFINLDALTGEKIVIQLNGKKYEMQPASVVGMIRFWKKLDGNDIAMQIEESLAFLYKLCPEAKTDEAFDNLSVEQLEQLIKEVTGNVEGQYAKIGEKPEETAKKKPTSVSPSQSS